MTIRIGGIAFDKFHGINVRLIYDSIASTFSTAVYFDPGNADQRQVLQPGLFPPVTIEHNGELLLTGTLLSYRFKSTAKKHLLSISGYSNTGVLEDCQIPQSIYPLQTNGLSFADIVRKIIKPFNLSLVIDKSVAEICDKVVESINADTTQTVKSYFSEIAGQLNVVVSHTNRGELLLTGYKTKEYTNAGIIVDNSVNPVDAALAGIASKAVSPDTLKNKDAIIKFTSGMPGIEFEQMFDGQRMHSHISVNGQYSIDGGNALTATPLQNPYVKQTVDWMRMAFFNTIGRPDTSAPIGYRPRMANQTTGTYLTTERAQRNILSEELKALPLRIEMRGWDINGKVIRPGAIIAITNPELHIYNEARFFVEDVLYTYEVNKVKETVILNCVVPETFNNDTPKNIFE